ncbi:MAG: fibrobacter succinogenes major paralogous domain-containing protein [Bacteroidales bacterium]|nr:fibrobacter succinogenes major paralogous domain-containing protein [Bacteroidales bacterium]
MKKGWTLFVAFQFAFMTFGFCQGDGYPCVNVPTVTDVDGNTYHTVQIGKQCWMKENMKCTKFADGKAIDLDTLVNGEKPLRFIPSGDESKVNDFGYLYNWVAASKSASSHRGCQGPCPNGWHVPSDADWTALTDYVAGIGRYRCDGEEANIAKALTSQQYWFSSRKDCAVGNDVQSNDATGFSAVPAGTFNGTFTGLGSFAAFWSATSYSKSYSFNRTFDFSEKTVVRGNDSKENGYSIRCIKD